MAIKSRPIRSDEQNVDRDINVRSNLRGWLIVSVKNKHVYNNFAGIICYMVGFDIKKLLLLSAIKKRHL